MSFSADISEKKENTIITLVDLASNTRVEIYGFGAILNVFEIVTNGNIINVIDGYSCVQDAVKNLQHMYKSAKLSPYPCFIKNGEYKFGTKKYFLKKPNAAPNGLHGLLYDKVFSVAETASREDHASVALKTIYDRKDEGFPFSYQCEVMYRLEKNNHLTIQTTITNLDNQLMPIADGWHTYFRFGKKIDECQLEFQSKEMLNLNEFMMPKGQFIPYQEFGSLKFINDKTFDDCFTLNFAECQPMCVFRDPGLRLQVEIHPTGSYPYLLVHTPKHRNSIAMANMSAPPDTLNNGLGLKVLSPGETITFTTKYVIKFV